MIYPSADIIEERVGSRYSLVVLAAKRAKQIKEGAPVLIDTASTNPLTIAMEEIAAGKVTVLQAEVVPVAPDADFRNGTSALESSSAETEQAGERFSQQIIASSADNGTEADKPAQPNPVE